ncbi:ammonia-forming cytochrome c nitrite reductase subunit c552 [Planctomycetota bacterium]|nr:ammonia-forming cytochrome c nitrite reductase subunit c552 [Planctomycetota bacterium]
MPGKAVKAVITVAVLATLSAPAWWPVAGDSDAPRPARSPSYSNIRAADYVGPETCAECHEDQHDLWTTHPHSRMNQDATPTAVLGDFANVTVNYAGVRTEFTRVDDAFFVTLTRRTRRRFLVTRTIGSRFMQMIVGRQVEGPEPPGDPVYTRELKLPFGYWFRLGRWLPEGYFDSDTPPELTDAGEFALPPDDLELLSSWTKNCVFCHNTYPYELRLASGPQQLGYPRDDLAFNAATASAEGQRVRAEGTLDPDTFVPLGISCESCHFGGREHADSDEDIRFVPTSPDLEFPLADALTHTRSSAYALNGVCAQCHAASVTCYAPGAATWNSREALDMLNGACATQLRCVDCHDPHTPGPPKGPAPRESSACAGCHTLAPDHTRHGAAVTCLDCHMPRIVQGLDSVVRTHQIARPVDSRSLAQAEPNACNLCHLDRSLAWTIDQVREGWGRTISVAPDWPAAALLDQPAGEVWLAHSTPTVRLVAADALSRSPQASQALPRLIKTLNDPYAVNRVFGLFAVERALGRQLTEDEYDLLAPAESRRAQLEALRSAGRRK